MKPIKNYTSSMPVERILAKIEECLVSIGANEVIKEYSDGTASGIKFKVRIGNGKILSFRIPAKIKEAMVILDKPKRSSKRRYVSPKQTKDLRESQGQRTAWKCILDWIEAQMAMIQLGQADAVEVFLPYVYNKGQTFYERITSEDHRLLLGE